MEKNKIIQMHNDGVSLRAIARELGLDRKTVTRYVKQYHEAYDKLFNPDASTQEIHEATELIAHEPTYPDRKRISRKWNAEMDAFLDSILAEDERKQRLLHTKKQRITVQQILELMHNNGFDIGYSTVCIKVREKRNRTPEVYIAQHYRYGDRFEYDFGEVKLSIAGKIQKLYLATIAMPASGARYALLYRTQTKDVFIDSHVRFFKWAGGTFKEGVYDNMRNVVSRFLSHNQKELNPDLIRLSNYYGFSINTCNCRCGNEKGSVERSVEVIRNAAFATVWEFASLKEAQTHLFDVIDRLNQKTTLKEELKALGPRIIPYEVADIRAGIKADNYCCCTYDGSHYSVPDTYAGLSFTLKAYPNTVEIWHKTCCVATHQRSYEKGSMVLQLSHYLRSLATKPGALKNSVALTLNEELKQIFDESYACRPKEFIRICQDRKDDDIQTLIERLKNHGAPLANDNKMSMLEMKTLEQISLYAMEVR